MTELINGVVDAIMDHESVDSGVIVTSFVLIAAFVGTDGESHIYSETVENQRCHETLGLLTYGLALENHRAVHGDDD